MEWSLLTLHDAALPEWPSLFLPQARLYSCWLITQSNEGAVGTIRRVD